MTPSYSPKGVGFLPESKDRVKSKIGKFAEIGLTSSQKGGIVYVLGANPMAKIGCYIRVSTADKGQTTAGQRLVIAQQLKDKHYNAGSIRWYEDAVSGRTLQRPALEKLLADVRAGAIDTVVSTRIDRLSRNTREGLQLLAELADRGVKVLITEQNIEFNGSSGKLIATLLLAFATFEADLISERTREGMRAAQARGVRVGRPKKTQQIDDVKALTQQGKTPTEIAADLDLKANNVRNIIRRYA